MARAGQDTILSGVLHQQNAFITQLKSFVDTSSMHFKTLETTAKQVNEMKQGLAKQTNSIKSVISTLNESASHVEEQLKNAVALHDIKSVMEHTKTLTKLTQQSESLVKQTQEILTTQQQTFGVVSDNKLEIKKLNEETKQQRMHLTKACKLIHTTLNDTQHNLLDAMKHNDIKAAEQAKYIINN